MTSNRDLPAVGDRVRLLKPCGNPGPSATVTAIAREDDGWVWIVCELDLVPYFIAARSERVVRSSPAAIENAMPEARP